ncbi:MAG: metallophosphoesterase, partial [Bacteroidales bacterium]|nr:metallophosphoesterase [Bacteroidales bacterium]
MRKTLLFILIAVFIFSCKKSDNETVPDISGAKSLTIFFVNDQHGQIDNFSKIKHIVDNEKQHVSVIVACGGDIFSGNPVVDFYDEKGYPMIDAMNRAGFDISVVGNHEYDYGEVVLKDRMEQAGFVWVCANVDMENTGVPEPYEYYTLSVDNLRVTFLGLVETNGKDNGTIPSTHPFRVQNFTFERPENVVAQYANIKEQENADLYIALTHLGHDGYSGNLCDFQLAEQFPYFDLIIGGHSHAEVNTTVNGIPIFQSGYYLHNLGKIMIEISDRSVHAIDFELINLDSYSDYDAG